MLRLRQMSAVSLMAFAFLDAQGIAYAASLRVAPVHVDLVAPTAATTLTISNDEDRPINVQVRLFRWQLKDGKDAYTPAQGVVASPPMTKLKARGENIIRIVRTSEAPLTSEESYRLIVDELPDPRRAQVGSVSLVVRHAIPVFFSSPDTNEANVAWSVTKAPEGLRVTARNTGERRMRVADVSVSAGRKQIGHQQGLVGYVLAHSVASWLIPSTGKAASVKGTIAIDAASETGPIHAAAGLR